MNKLMRWFAVTLSVVTLTVSGCAGIGQTRQSRIDALRVAACESVPQSSSPWHIANLYDCATQSLYVPYQLWTGAHWSGSRSEPCMHEANSRFNVDGDSLTSITGPIDWTHPRLGTQHRVWSREKVSGTKVQLFSCHEKGIGRLYDNRREQFFSPGRCKFPAGSGWPLLQQRQCLDTTIEITTIELNEHNELIGLKFKWWYDGMFDHIYRYAPNVGMTNAWRQSRPRN